MTNPTPEQAAILSAASTIKDNLLINALAGTGKTTTLELLNAVLPQRPALYLAFNKRIVDEAKPRFLSTTTVLTFNSQGHRIWAKGRSVKLDFKKSQTIFRELVDAAPRSARDAMWDCYYPVIDAVGRAKALGYVPEGSYDNARRLTTQQAFHRSLEETPDDLTADLIDSVLNRSIALAYKGTIDFNDQLYMPALFGGIFPQFPCVLVDEAQDLNPVQHELLNRLIRHRTIIVGDRYQSIYGFRGAKQGGMDDLSSRFSTRDFPLSVSFRCPQTIVEAARWRVPTFQWIKPGGHVDTLTKLPIADIIDNAAIICRNNAPLFKLALHLLTNGRSVEVAGSEIGAKLIGIMKRLGDDSTSQTQFLAAIADWLAEKLDRESTTAQDMADCMRVFAKATPSLSAAIGYVEHIFAQKGSLQLMTGHKAKGLEFDTVYFLDSHLCRDSEQDMNLRYVIQTRAKENLFYVDSEAIE